MTTPAGTTDAAPALAVEGLSVGFGRSDIIRDLHAVTFQELNPVREAWQQDRFRDRIGAFGDNTKSPRTSVRLSCTPTRSSVTATAITRSVPLK